MARPMVGSPGSFRRWLDDEIQLVREACLEAVRLHRDEAADRLLRRFQRLCRARYRLVRGCDGA